LAAESSTRASRTLAVSRRTEAASIAQTQAPTPATIKGAIQAQLIDWAR
jgi:hypothetical protein